VAELQQSSDIYGILLDRSTAQVLMLHDEKGDWTLPHVHVPDKCLWSAMVGPISSAMGNALETQVTVLRNVSANYAADGSHVDLIYELENHSEGWMLPPQSKWIDSTLLKNLTLTYEEHRAMIEAELEAAQSNQFPGLRPAWARAGWFKAASAWMRDQLIQQNYALRSSIEQVKSWGISCLLRVETDRGNIFFKVASSRPLFGNEPVVLAALSERYPDLVPAPIAIEPEQRWMLTQDFGAELRTMPTLDRWETAISRFGQLQLQAVSIVEDLLAVGCLDRRLEILSQQIDPLLQDADILALLSPDEIAQLQALAPRLKAMCSELTRYRVPYSLNHGDLHSGNITGQTLLFFDWTDACIAHPFLDLSTVVAYIEEQTPVGRERVLDVYLNLWTAYEPIERLRVMWQLAEPLGALHQAVSYQHILAALEPTSKPEMVEEMLEWLRRIIRTMPQN
jgi:hypothetical protein